MDLRLVTRVLGPVTVVGVGGEIDNYTAPQLRAALDAAVDGGAQRLIVDLTDTDFLDSSGLGVLVGVSKAGPHSPASLAVACPKEHLRRLFEISRLDEVIRIYSSLDAAVGPAG
jgi:anti-sigma B factor antagonist